MNAIKRTFSRFTRRKGVYFNPIRFKRQFFSTKQLKASIPNAKQSFISIQTRKYIDLLIFRYPMVGGGVIGGLKAGFADYFTQHVVESRIGRVDIDNQNRDKSKINWKRTFLFGLLGFTYGGFINYFLHSYLNPLLWGTAKTPSVVAKSILFEQTVHVPFFSFPIFYGFKGLVYSNGDINESKKYIKHYWNVSFYDDLLMCWKLWIPCHIITYGIVPRTMRVYWVNCISATWTGILSYKRGEVKRNEPAMDKNNINNNNNDNNETITNNKDDVVVVKT